MTAYIIMGIVIATLAVVVLAQHFNLKDADKLIKSMEDKINSLNNTITDLKTDLVMFYRDKVKEGHKGSNHTIPWDLDDLDGKTE